MSFNRIGPVALLVFLVVAFAWFAFHREHTAAGRSAPVASAPAGYDGEPGSAWVAATSKSTQIGKRAIAAYVRAAMRIDEDDPDCRLAWNTLAGIADIESNHGYYGGSQVDKDGVARPGIIGIPLDGSAGVLAIRDTDNGRLDGDTKWDRAVGPFQFIPTTWERWGADADGDGKKNPQSIEDAALAAGRYLCHSGGDLGESRGWSDAVLTYNRSVAYATKVARMATKYANAT